MFPNPRTPFGRFIALLQTGFYAVFGKVLAARLDGLDAAAGSQSSAVGQSPAAFVPQATSRLRVLFYDVNPIIAVDGDVTFQFFVFDDTGAGVFGVPVPLPAGNYPSAKWHTLPLTPGAIPPSGVEPGNTISAVVTKNGAGAILGRYLVEVVLAPLGEGFSS